MFRYLGWSVSMNKPRRFRKTDPASLNRGTRRLGAAELLFNAVPQILQQMEAVGHLPSLWRSLAGALRVKTAAVTAHYLNRRMTPEPVSSRFGGPILQDIENFAALHVPTMIVP